MKKANLYGITAAISLLATVILRYLWITIGNGKSPSLAVSMFAFCALFSFAVAVIVTNGWSIRRHL